jgi:hypothetical protein
VTGIIDNSKTQERKHWMELLHTGWMYHQQKVKELASPVLGAEMTDDEIFHMAVSVAIQDCIALIQQLEAFGYFEEEEPELSTPGPAG